MTIKADHPAFNIYIDIRQAQEDCDKAGDCMENLDLKGAAVRIKVAQEALAKASYYITLMASRGDKPAPKKREPKLEPLPDYGDHMTWESFKDSCESGGFIDDDGTGDLATATQVSGRSVSPSRALDPNWRKPKWATHVVWYNK